MLILIIIIISININQTALAFPSILNDIKPNNHKIARAL